ncbi:serine O-acetyltransferase EpsC [Tenuifilum thalassicum]|uniref:Serine acetyltransferase n=1 Tax=Tenuifilum thalassicum TaxID=2590900 RepID=A0A7D3XYE7_9BACT|nr:serine O-acetyltransferase EpsC [Tenuifilum thalassicum]QKG79133.1 serine acetyltransferase [Tenuifilum thalassicum]
MKLDALKGYSSTQHVISEFSEAFTEMVFLSLTRRDATLIYSDDFDTSFKTVLNLVEADNGLAANYVASISSKLPSLISMLEADAKSIYNNDPAAESLNEVLLAYPGFFAIAHYRIANLLYNEGIKIIPRLITEYAHSKTGIDIHPAATIGSEFFIDHGTGIVIGATTVIGNRVKIYQGVTLGALSVSKSMSARKRHPTIEDDVVIYAGSTILGGSTVIGHNSTIGGNVWLVKSVPPYSKVYHESKVVVKSQSVNF